MASELKQTGRLFSFDSPLGPDKLLVRSFQGTEYMSQLFRFDVELVSTDFNISYDAILGKNVTVGIRQSDDSTFRYFNGYVSKIRQVRGPGRLAVYQAEMVPWLWFLTLTADCFIYQKKKIPDVIEDIFKKWGFKDYELKLQGTHNEWEYCCQYRESAFRFVSRLMEIEGIFYFFRHEQGKHTLVMADHKGVHTPCEFVSNVRFEHSPGGGYQSPVDTIVDWQPETKVFTGKHTHKEFNFEQPWQSLLSERQSRNKASREYEVYDYPGEYEIQQEGDEWIQLRLQEHRTDFRVSRGQGNCRSLQPGYRFDLSEHDRDDQNSSYVLTQVTHQGHEGSFLTGTDSGASRYENTFACIPAKTQFRPPRRTQKAQMLGTQTATVVGPKGEEIYTDKYGRVKVQFHWDREGKRDENSSCYVRVSQPWTGNNWGQIWIPRIGQEVVVDFLEGDPDRPLITGCVYNADNMPPYKLPDNQTRSGVKTRSSKGGKEENYNELRLEDKKGEELFLMHAEKDMDTSVEKDLYELVEQDRHIKVKGEHREKIEGEMSHQADKSRNEKVGQDYFLQAGGVIHLKASTIILDATDVYYLSSGGHIDIKPEGVIIEGPMVWINSGMARPGGARDAQPEDPKKGFYEKEKEKPAEQKEAPKREAEQTKSSKPSSSAASSSSSQSSQQQMMSEGDKGSRPQSSSGSGSGKSSTTGSSGSGTGSSKSGTPAGGAVSGASGTTGSGMGSGKSGPAASGAVSGASGTTGSGSGSGKSGPAASGAVSGASGTTGSGSGSGKSGPAASGAVSGASGTTGSGSGSGKSGPAASGAVSGASGTTGSGSGSGKSGPAASGAVSGASGTTGSGSGSGKSGPAASGAVSGASGTTGSGSGSGTQSSAKSSSATGSGGGKGSSTGGGGGSGAGGGMGEGQSPQQLAMDAGLQADVRPQQSIPLEQSGAASVPRSQDVIQDLESPAKEERPFSKPKGPPDEGIP